MRPSTPHIRRALTALAALLAFGMAAGREPEKPETPELPKPRVIDGKADARGAAWAPDGKSLIVVGADGLRIIDPATGKATKTIEVPKQAYGRIAVSPDGKLAAVQGRDKTMRVWDLAAGKEVHSRPGIGNNPVDIVFTPDGKYLAMGAPRSPKDIGVEGQILILNTDGWTVHQEIKSSLYLYTLGLSRDGRVALGPAGSYVEIYSADKGYKQRVLYTDDLKETCNAVAWRSDGKVIVSGGWGKRINVWDFDGTRPTMRFGGLKGAVGSLAFRPDSNLLACGDYENNLYLWDVSQRKPLVQVALDCSLHCVQFSPDGKTLAAAGTDGKVRLWDVSAFKAPLGPVPGKPVPPKAPDRIKGTVGSINLKQGTLRVSWTTKDGFPQYRDVGVANEGTVILLKGKEIDITELRTNDEVELVRHKLAEQILEMHVIKRSDKP
jgi:WD40 repeat protein